MNQYLFFYHKEIAQKLVKREKLRDIPVRILLLLINLEVLRKMKEILIKNQEK